MTDNHDEYMKAYRAVRLEEAKAGDSESTAWLSQALNDVITEAVNRFTGDAQDLPISPEVEGFLPAVKEKILSEISQQKIEEIIRSESARKYNSGRPGLWREVQAGVDAYFMVSELKLTGNGAAKTLEGVKASEFIAQKTGYVGSKDTLYREIRRRKKRRSRVEEKLQK